MHTEIDMPAFRTEHPPEFGPAPTTRRTRSWPMAVSAVGVVAAAAAQPWLPGAQDYISKEGIGPSWAAGAGGVVASIAVLAMARYQTARGSRRSSVLSAGWLAAGLLLWAAVGVVFDCFRAFFWATGIPAGDFERVDWPGFLTRAIAFVAVLSSVSATRAYGRLTGDGRGHGARIAADGDQGNQRRWPGYAACGFGCVYPAVKYYWWAGGRIGRPGNLSEGFPVFETLLLAGGVVLSLGLVRPWGLVFPRWTLFLHGRPVPRLLPVTAGSLLAAALLLQGLIPLFAMLNHVLLDGPPLPFSTDGANNGVIGVVYGGWALFGLTLAIATGDYWRLTRKAGVECGT
jgi:hypothetical protein